MKLTLSIIKADVGSLGGHIKPSERLLSCVKGYLEDEFKSVIYDFFVSHTGDDIAILLSHALGVNSHAIHKLAWDAFRAGTECAKEQGLYGAGQDLLKDSFSGNIKGMGPAVARDGIRGEAQ